MFITLGVPVDKLEFVVGTSYQLSAGIHFGHVQVSLLPSFLHGSSLSRRFADPYTRFHSLTTAKAAGHAGADVVKQSESPLMSSMLYPGLQALDEQYLDVHFQFGGADQVS